MATATTVGGRRWVPGYGYITVIERKRPSSSRRKALRAQVGERDGWTCGICFAPIDRSLVWPHPRSACLDHVRPAWAGGTSEPYNLQIAHAVCNLYNVMKWDQLPIGAEECELGQRVLYDMYLENFQGQVWRENPDWMPEDLSAFIRRPGRSNNRASRRWSPLSPENSPPTWDRRHLYRQATSTR